MRALELDGTRAWFAEKDAFVAAESTVESGIAFQGGRTGMSGGAGFVLEKFTGEGSLFIAGAGNFIDLNPSQYGGKIQVDTGCVVAFDDQINYNVERIGKFTGQGTVIIAAPATSEGPGPRQAGSDRRTLLHERRVRCHTADR